MKIAVLSDTHGLLRPEVLEQIESCDALIHAGDIGSQRIIDEIFIHLKPRVPVYFVRGNNDGAWASHLLKCQRFTLDGVNFCVVHEKKDVPWNLEETQIVIYGHTHKYEEREKEGRCGTRPPQRPGISVRPTSILQSDSSIRHYAFHVKERQPI